MNIRHTEERPQTKIRIVSIMHVFLHPLNRHASINYRDRKTTEVTSLSQPDSHLIKFNSQTEKQRAAHALVPQGVSPEFVGYFLTIKTFNPRSGIIYPPNVPAVRNA